LVLTVLSLAALTAEHTAAQRAAGLRPRLSTVAPLALAAKFANSVAKSGGLAGLAVFRAEARRKGQPLGPVAAAYLLVTALDVLAFALVLVAALSVLVASRRFTRADAVATAVFGAYVAVVVTAAVCAARSRAAIRGLYALPHRVRRRLGRRAGDGGQDLVPDHTAADELFDAVAVIRQRPWTASVAGLGALAVDLVGAVQLWTVLAALAVHVTLSGALVAYGLSTLLGIVGVVPGGLGFVEFSLAAVLVSYGTALGVAAAAVALYRIAEFWLPLAAGASALHRIGSSRRRR
jgi:uncharacterized protein (TIRG00374 family)